MKTLIKRLISSVTAVALMVQFAAPYGEIFEKLIPINSVSAEEALSEEPQEEVANTDNDEIIESGEAEYEDWTIISDEQLTSKKDVRNLVVNGGTLDLNEQSLIVHGDVTINSGTVRMNKGEIICENFTMHNGYFYMNNVNDHVVANGNFSYKNGNFYDGYMTAGTIEIKGDFTSTGSYFRPSLEHKVILNGSEKQTVSFTGFYSYFNILEIWNTSAQGVYSSLPILANQIVGDLSKLCISDNGNLGFTLTEDLTLEEDFVLAAGTLDLAGHTLTINGNLIQSGGEVLLNGGTLNVTGDYRLETRKGNEGSYTYNYSTGYLTMTNPDDQLNVNGNFVMGSTQDHKGRLTAGTMRIKGDFEQKTYKSGNNFSASGTHTVVFEGDKSHTISFASANGTLYSYFANLDLGNETITVNNRAVVTGELTGDGCQTTGYIDLAGSAKVIGEFNGNIRTGNSYTLNSDIHVKGNVYVDTDLNLNGNELTVEGNIIVYYNRVYINKGKLTCYGNIEFTFRGYMTMQNAEDIVKVTGDFIYPTSHEVSTLSNGKLYIAGDCTINGNYLRGSGNHEVIFNGTEKQTISFANTNSYFNKVIFSNTSEEGIYVATALNASSVVNENGCKVTFADDGNMGTSLIEDKIIEGDYCLSMGTLDLNGHTLTINGNLIQSGGEVLLNGGTLNVTGDYRLETRKGNEGSYTYNYSTGYLTMTNPDDQLNVSGNFVMGSTQDHKGRLTAGTMRIKGDFEQKTYKSGNNFSASGNHTVVFEGSEKQNVSFASPNSSYSYFQNVIFNNPNKVSLNTNAYVNGTVTDSTGTVTGNGYVYITKLSQLIDGKFGGNIYLNNAYDNQDIHMKNDITVGNFVCSFIHLNGFQLSVNNITINRTLYVENGVLEAKGNLTLGNVGHLSMKNEADYVWVGGSFTTNLTGGNVGDLIAGVLEIKGDFIQNYSSTFTASGNHTVILSGRNAMNGRVLKQTVKFYTPGTSKFNKLIITKPLSQYVFMNSSSNVVSSDLFYNELVENYIDVEAPTKVEGLIATDVQTTSVQLLWDASSDDVGVMGYEIYRNNKKIYTTSNTEFIDNGLDPKSKYIYEIYAFDECRNYSVASEPLTITTLNDMQAPTVPQNLKVQSRTGSSITLNWNPSTDNVKTIGYTIYRDGKEVADVKNITLYKDASLEAKKTYSYTVSAYDAAGNSSDISEAVSGVPVMPSIESVQPKDYTEIGGKTQEISVVFANTGNSTGNKVKFEYKLSGESDSKYKDILGYLAGQQNYSSNKLTAKCLWNLKGLNGNYDIRITLYDADNNECVKVVSYIVDTSGSATPTEFKATSVNGRVELIWSPSISANCSYYNIYRADSDSDNYEKIAKITGSTTARYIDGTVVSEKSYSYKISAVSKFGVEGELSDSVSVSVGADLDSPLVDYIKPDASRVNKQVDIEVKATDNIAVESIILEYQAVDDTQWTLIEEKTTIKDIAKIAWDTTALTDGAYLLRAIAIDVNGNQSDAFTKAYTVDNTGPEKVFITEDECTVSSSYVSIRWEDITDHYFGYYVVEYQNENGEFVEAGRTSTTAGMHIENLKADTTYTFRVVAYDDLGNRGVVSDAIELTTISDTVVPVIQSFYPASSAFSKEIKIDISASDNIAVEKLVLRYSYDEDDEKNWTDLTNINSKDFPQSEKFTYAFDVSEMSEGEIFVEAVVYDIAGNASKSCVNSFKIDRTSANDITNLNANGSGGNVHLTWTASDSDISFYEIYRAEDGVTMYAKIDDCKTKDYYDTTVDFGKIYTYKIVAVDIAGNKSGDSNEAIAQVMVDTQAPEIIGFNPAADSFLPENPNIHVVASDNNRLSSVTVSYQIANSTDTMWYEIGTYELNSNYQSANFTWNTDDLDEGEYQLRATAVDVAGNISEPFTAKYTLRKASTNAPVLELFQENWAIRLEWSNVQTDDFSFYRLFKKSSTDSKFQCVGDLLELTYTDLDVDVNTTYTYKVEIHDKFGNFTESNVMSGFAYNVDTIAPVMNVPDTLFGTTGMQLMLDGTECTDNVRITKFTWEMGNGETIYGGRVPYIYNEAGEYIVTLTAEDAEGNRSKAKFKAVILDKNEYGSLQVEVVDAQGKPIKFAYVYMYSPEDKTEKTLKTDSNGLVTLSGKLGSYQLAAYKEGYLPVRQAAEISAYGDNGSTKITLQSGELVTGKISVRRMSLEEMIQAGIDLTDPANFHTITFEIELTFAQEPIPMLISGSMGYGGFGGGGAGGGWIGGSSYSTKLPDGSKFEVKMVAQEEDEEVLPILAYVRTSEEISFMKEMYAVELGVMNNATSDFYIKDSRATLNLPSGLSLAATTSVEGNTWSNGRVQEMGVIQGQKSASAYWAVKGDKKGEYGVEADFSGVLMPFNVPVRANFKTENTFNVGVGKGLHLYIFPQEYGYIGRPYYIQYMLTNEGTDTFYNLKTSFGKKEDPGYVQEVGIVDADGNVSFVDWRVDEDNLVYELYNKDLGDQRWNRNYEKYFDWNVTEDGGIKDAETDEYIYYPGTVDLLQPIEEPVDYGFGPGIDFGFSQKEETGRFYMNTPGGKVSIGVFYPGQSLRGTYKTVFSGEGDPDKVRYRLIESLVTGYEDTDIQVHIMPIPSHINKMNVQDSMVKNIWADPVDMTTGAFLDNITAMSVMGDSALALNLNYNSMTVENKGSLGYGWNHDYEAYLDFKDEGMIDVHWNAGSYASFVGDDSVVRQAGGKIINNVLYLNPVDDTGFRNYIPISDGMEDYKLWRNDDGSYTLTQPGGNKMEFNADGKLVQIVQNNGKTMSLEHFGNSTVITEDITGVSITLEHNSDGLLTSVKDNNGRMAYMSYENNLLKTITNALGETVSYTYDENGRVATATAGGAEEPYVTNEYNDKNRVVTQYDALGNVTTFDHDEDTNGNLTVTGTDRNNNTVVFKSDSMGKVLEITDQNGHVTSYQYDEKGNMIAETNGKGNTISYSYDGINLTKITEYQGYITTMEYDDKGNILTVEGEGGEKSTYTYNPKNLLETTAENSGIRRTYTYNESSQVVTESVTGLGVKYYEYTNGRISAITDFCGNKAVMTYDEYGNLQSTTDRDGNIIVYHYDALGRPASVVTADGTISYIYDGRGNQTSITDANGNTTFYTYDGNNRLVSEENAKGEVTKYSYDNEDRLLTTQHPDGTVFTNVYDAVGNIIKTVNENGEVCKFTYDAVDQMISMTTINGDEEYTESYSYYANGKLKKITFADGTSESYKYDTAWRLTSVTDEHGNSAKTEYDIAGNAISVTDMEGNKSSYTYDIYGRVLTAVDANGNTTEFNEYDANGNCLKKTNPDGLVIKLAYSGEGLLTKVTTGSVSVLFEYDSAGRVKNYTNEEGYVFATEYDANGNLVKLVDANGNTVQENVYDEINNLVLTTDALGIETQLEYDNMGVLKETISNLNTAREAKASYTYDNAGRVTDVVDAENGTASYEYDQVGNITAMIDPNGGRTEYSYDSMGRITESLNAVGSKNTYGYNAKGLLESAENSRGQETSYTYYKNGWLKSFTDELGTVSYTYDSNGNVLTVTDENGTITREYDEMNRVTKYTDFNGKTIGYAYDQLGNLVAITYPGGRIVRYSYYKTGNVKTVTDWDNGVTSYEYDGNGQLTKTTRPDGSEEVRTYDAAGRLLSQEDKNGEEVINSRDYSYDEAGNITNVEMSNATNVDGLTSAKMEYDDCNRLIKFNGKTVKYDADGNMTYGPLGGKMVDFEYDCRNRLVSAGGISYKYDAENNRISKTVNDVETKFVVDTVMPLSRVLTSETQGITTFYVYGTGLISQENAGEWLFYHFNNIGSTETVTDLEGNVVETFEYGPYGELTSENRCGIIFLYNGEYGVSTDENGLYYMRARYYNPEIKRFINQDVIIGTITNSPTMNRYAYVQGNPISLADPFGLSPQTNWFMHSVLDVLGMIPVFGCVFDAANAVCYAIEGDWFGCVTSAISALPGLGDIVGGTMQLINKSSKMACQIIRISNIAGNCGKLVKGSYVIGSVLEDNVERYLINGEDFDLKQFGVDLFTIGFEMFAMKGAWSDLKVAQTLPKCFIAGTLVTMADGEKPIEEVEVGDEVLSMDYETGEVAVKKVTETFVNETDELVHVNVNGEEIVATPEHPFYVAKFGWTLAADLRAGDVLVLSNGEYVVVEFVQHEILESPVKVYNFEVEDYHTYFVGESSVLVHNDCGISRNAALRQAKRDAGIPVNQQPQKVEKVKMTSAESAGSHAVLDNNGKVIYTREYHYTNNNGDKIIIQDHGAGHQFTDDIGNQGPHFNVRPGNNPRTGSVQGALDHYPFSK